MPKVSTKEQYSNAVQGDYDLLQSSYQTSGNPDFDGIIENQVSFSKQPGTES